MGDNTRYYSFIVDIVTAETVNLLGNAIDEKKAPQGLSVGKMPLYSFNNSIGALPPHVNNSLFIAKVDNRKHGPLATGVKAIISEPKLNTFGNNPYYKTDKYYQDIDSLLFNDGFLSPDGIGLNETFEEDLVLTNKSSQIINEWDPSNEGDRKYICYMPFNFTEKAAEKKTAYPTRQVSLAGLFSRTTTFPNPAGVRNAFEESEFRDGNSFRITIEFENVIEEIKRFRAICITNSQYRITWFNEDRNKISSQIRTFTGGRGEQNKMKTLTEVIYF